MAFALASLALFSVASTRESTTTTMGWTMVVPNMDELGFSVAIIASILACVEALLAASFFLFFFFFFFFLSESESEDEVESEDELTRYFNASLDDLSMLVCKRFWVDAMSP